MFILMMLGLASADDDNCFEKAEITARYGGKIVAIAQQIISDDLFWRFEIPQSIFTKNDVGALKADHDWSKMSSGWWDKKPYLSKIYPTRKDPSLLPEITSLKMEDKPLTFQKEIVKICTLK